MILIVILLAFAIANAGNIHFQPKRMHSFVFWKPRLCSPHAKFPVLGPMLGRNLTKILRNKILIERSKRFHAKKRTKAQKRDLKYEALKPTEEKNPFWKVLQSLFSTFFRSNLNAFLDKSTLFLWRTTPHKLYLWRTTSLIEQKLILNRLITIGKVCT